MPVSTNCFVSLFKCRAYCSYFPTFYQIWNTYQRIFSFISLNLVFLTTTFPWFFDTTIIFLFFLFIVALVVSPEINSPIFFAFYICFILNIFCICHVFHYILRTQTLLLYSIFSKPFKYSLPPPVYVYFSSATYHFFFQFNYAFFLQHEKNVKPFLLFLLLSLLSSFISLLLLILPRHFNFRFIFFLDQFPKFYWLEIQFSPVNNSE